MKLTDFLTKPKSVLNQSMSAGNTQQTFIWWYPHPYMASQIVLRCFFVSVPSEVKSKGRYGLWYENILFELPTNTTSLYDMWRCSDRSNYTASYNVMSNQLLASILIDCFITAHWVMKEDIPLAFAIIPINWTVTNE